VSPIRNEDITEEVKVNVVEDYMMEDAGNKF
jgi:hypothetical protein